MTAPTSSGGTTPWKWRWALIFALAVGVVGFPSQTADTLVAGRHGVAVIWCRLAPSACHNDQPSLPPLPGAEQIRAQGQP